ncbi:uncharacterized protein V1516DRAFT_681524 [Lipomyces oligophaga]|uniref:uncharacterized protein n=1 Tax=Lipomyces oligophaga TaxID=45792 RepID=UPI0034CE8A17
MKHRHDTGTWSCRSSAFSSRASTPYSDLSRNPSPSPSPSPCRSPYRQIVANNLLDVSLRLDRRVDPASVLPAELFFQILQELSYPYFLILASVSRRWHALVEDYLTHSPSAYAALDFFNSSCASVLSSTDLAILIKRSRGFVHTIRLARHSTSPEALDISSRTARMLLWQTIISFSPPPEGTDITVGRLSNLRTLSLPSSAAPLVQSWSGRLDMPNLDIFARLENLSIPPNVSVQLLRFLSRHHAMRQCDFIFPNLRKLEIYGSSDPIIDRQLQTLGGHRDVARLPIFPSLTELYISGTELQEPRLSLYASCPTSDDSIQDHNTVLSLYTLRLLLAASPNLDSLVARSCVILRKDQWVLWTCLIGSQLRAAHEFDPWITHLDAGPASVPDFIDLSSSCAQLVHLNFEDSIVPNTILFPDLAPSKLRKLGDADLHAWEAFH